jgi:hypothetical protein
VSKLPEPHRAYLDGQPWHPRGEVGIKPNVQSFPVYSDSVEPYNFGSGFTWTGTIEYVEDYADLVRRHGRDYGFTVTYEESRLAIRRRLAHLAPLVRRSRGRRLLGVKRIAVKITVPNVVFGGPL